MPSPEFRSMPRPPEIDLAIALRRATAGIHAEIEHLPLMSRLTSETVTLDDYRYYLRAILAIHAPLEQTLYARLDASVNERLGVRPKLPALLNDLDEQGLKYNMAALTVTPAIALPNDLSATIGGLYVLEGATLGGRTIARHLRRLIGEPLGSTRFLDFHGQQTSASWKAFTGALNTLAAQHTLVPDRVIAGALAVFDHVYKRLESSGGA
ncbi:biliverdin-producing heme oxygenase [Allochromatium vinosum]|nr:biliverdin-producing heme oxygenase [Allochromatium vinosum]